MKFHTTQKAIRDGYINTICVSYCGLQSLLAYENPIAYTTRREGWGADIYELNTTTAVITGYAPFGKIRPGYDVCHKYEIAAEKIQYDYKKPWEERRDALKDLQKEFVWEVCKNDN